MRSPRDSPALASGEALSRAAKPAPHCTLMVFGANGGLTSRLSLPAPYNLAGVGLLDDGVSVLGVDRDQGGDQDFRHARGMRPSGSKPQAGAARAIAHRLGRQSAARARDTLVAIMLLASAGASAQQPAPPGMGLAEAAAKRFPQPVRVGDLIGRTVLRPLESQPVLGHVKQVVRATDGTVDVVLDYGGLLGFGGRLIAVPADAMVLLGAEMEVVDFTPKQLDDFATFNGSGVMAVPPQDSIRVGLARPSH